MLVPPPALSPFFSLRPMTSLYRRWRSQSFDDLLGQDHVTRTLRNAVRTGRVAHAYLFTGPRGTGKTSTARILAKAVNCLNPVEGSPCNECSQCVATNEGRALDVIEIDAASNTGVDNVRDLRERVAYAAGEGQYKVYIVDEVHRLSGAAFDAFLKTLEEPPAHVIFVFASTEPQKVPATITSRCQRFDFRRIPTLTAEERVLQVAGEEGIPLTPEAASLIALHANGSLRDALGVLDQVSAYTQGQIGAEDVRHALGLAAPQLVGELTDALVGGDTATGLRHLQEFVDGGGDPRQLVRQFVEYWRVILLRTSGATGAEVGIDPALRECLVRHASRVGREGAVRVIRILTAAEFTPRFNVPVQLPVEMAFVEAALVLGGPASPAQDPNPPTMRAEHPAAGGDSGPVPPTPAGENHGEGVGPVPPAPGPAVPAGPPPDATLQAAIDTWPRVVEGMRHHRSLQAILRDGFPIARQNGELTVGFKYDFHVSRFMDAKDGPRARKALEDVVSQVLGVPTRVRCVKVSKDDLERLGTTVSSAENDGFVEELEERLRRSHATELPGKG